jgi:hypothetical protein
MARYSLRTLLLLVAVVSLWLSTIAGYESAYDVQSFLMLGVLVASAVAAISYDGRRRAFWVGFFLAVLTASVGSGSPFVHTAFALPWAPRLLNAYGIRQNLPNGSLDTRYFFWLATIHALVRLLIATVMGLLGVLVYETIHRKRNLPHQQLSSEVR